MAAVDQIYGQAQITVHEDMAHLVRENHESNPPKCKIIATMGPKCWEVEQIVSMMDAGMNVARMNMSHGDNESHLMVMQRLRDAMKQRPHTPIATMIDTRGREIRTGMFAAGGTVQLVAGQTLKITTDYSFKGDVNCISCNYQELCTAGKVGQQILIANGSVMVEITEVGDTYVNTKVLNSAQLGEHKNMNLPGIVHDGPVLTDADKKDLTGFAIPQGVDFIAISFAQSADDIAVVRKTLGPRGRRIKLIAKIESEEGLRNFDAILEKVDGVVVARGNLGMELRTEKVFLAQKMMIAKANLAGKPVITATQMLESMISNPRPTRAEASDVANAVLDGTDCVMLSGETANGNFATDAVKAQHKICVEAESLIDYETLFRTINSAAHTSLSDIVCASAVKTSLDMGLKLIVVLTETGSTARLVAKYRPSAMVFACCASESTIAHLQVVRSVTAIQVPSFKGTESVLHSALESAKERGLVKSGDCVVAVHGMKEEMPGGSSLMKVVQVE